MPESHPYAIDRLFQDALAAGLRRHKHGGAVLKITAGFSPDERRQLSAALAEVIQSEVPAGDLDVEASGAGQLAPAGLDSAIFKLRHDGAVDKIVFLRVKDAVADAVLPLIGLAVAAWGGDVTKLITPAAQSVKSVWTNLVTLTREKDAVAIDVYEALSIARAMARAEGGGFPSTRDIKGMVAAESPSAVVAALKRLAKLKLIEIHTWGANIDDEAHDDNTWRIRL
jgi:hypothetical protein